MTSHEWSDPHLAGIARRATEPRYWPTWWLWLTTAVLLGAGWCVGWWVF